jgi:hypothetical protein
MADIQVSDYVLLRRNENRSWRQQIEQNVSRWCPRSNARRSWRPTGLLRDAA